MHETEMRNRQEMANLVLSDDAHDKTTNCDGKTKLPGACSAAAYPLFSLFAAHNNIIKDVHISEDSSKKGQKLSNKSIPDVDVQDQDNNMQSNGNTSLPDASLEFLAAAPLARSSFANNSLNGGIKSKDACGPGKSTLREVRQNWPTPLYPLMPLIWKPCLLLHFYNVITDEVENKVTTVILLT